MDRQAASKLVAGSRHSARIYALVAIGRIITSNIANRISPKGGKGQAIWAYMDRHTQQKAY